MGSLADAVMMETPFVERANKNPMDFYGPMQGPLHDYGSWIMSGLWPDRKKTV